MQCNGINLTTHRPLLLLIAMTVTANAEAVTSAVFASRNMRSWYRRTSSANASSSPFCMHRASDASESLCKRLTCAFIH